MSDDDEELARWAEQMRELSVDAARTVLRLIDPGVNATDAAVFNDLIRTLEPAEAEHVIIKLASLTRAALAARDQTAARHLVRLHLLDAGPENLDGLWGTPGG